MDLSKLSLIFKIIIIGIVYIIIFFALRIMYKDIKNGGKRRTVRRSSFGLETVEVTGNSNLRKGAVIPLKGEITIGRRTNNLLVLDDHYVSGYHARIFPKNNQFILEDLGSTNGTLLNGEKVSGKIYLKSGDEVRIGNTVFKVIA